MPTLSPWFPLELIGLLGAGLLIAGIALAVLHAAFERRPRQEWRCEWCGLSISRAQRLSARWVFGHGGGRIHLRCWDEQDKERKGRQWS